MRSPGRGNLSIRFRSRRSDEDSLCATLLPRCRSHNFHARMSPVATRCGKSALHDPNGCECNEPRDGNRGEHDCNE